MADAELEHGVNANLVFKWRRAKRERKRPAGTVRQTVLLPVTIEPQEPLLAGAPSGHATVVKEGVIEIETGGAHVVLRGRIDPASVRGVLIGSVSLTPAQLSMLLEEIDWKIPVGTWQLTPAA